VKELIPRPELIIFDLDGTLADTFNHMAESLAYALEPVLGRRIPAEEVFSHFGPGAGTEQIIIHKYVGAEGSAVYERYSDYYNQHHEQMPLFPGIEECIAICRASTAQLALMTGKGRRTAEMTLQHRGIIDAFDVIVTGDEATCPKPDPMGVNMILAELQIAPTATMFIGDTRSDVLAGKNAGTYIGLVTWNNPIDAAQVAELYHPDIVFQTGFEMADWLRTILGVSPEQLAANNSN